MDEPSIPQHPTIRIYSRGFAVTVELGKKDTSFAPVLSVALNARRWITIPNRY